MSDIFISYSREDKQIAKLLASELMRYGWSVWWDRHIPAGKSFEEVIEAELISAKCVIVLWSGHSTKSNWVRDEANEGLNRNILLPIIIRENTTIPLGFRRIQTANLSSWQGSTEDEEFQKLLMDIKNFANITSALDKEILQKPIVHAEVEKLSITDSSQIQSANPFTLKQLSQNVIAKQLEIDAWNKAKSQNTVMAYADYINLFPNGLHVNDASDKIKLFDGIGNILFKLRKIKQQSTGEVELLLELFFIKAKVWNGQSFIELGNIKQTGCLQLFTNALIFKEDDLFIEIKNVGEIGFGFLDHTDSKGHLYLREDKSEMAIEFYFIETTKSIYELFCSICQLHHNRKLNFIQSLFYNGVDLTNHNYHHVDNEKNNLIVFDEVYAINWFDRYKSVLEEGKLILTTNSLEYISDKFRIEIDAVLNIYYLPNDNNNLTYNFVVVDFLEKGIPGRILFAIYQFWGGQPTKVMYNKIAELANSGKLNFIRKLTLAN